MSREQELRSQISRLREELDEIEHDKEEYEKRDMVGKCFKYKNCYSMPQSESDYFFLYTRVFRHVDGNVKILQFQTDMDGCVRIDVEEMIFPRVHGEEISSGEFEQALGYLVTHLDTILSHGALKAAQGGE